MHSQRNPVFLFFLAVFLMSCTTFEFGIETTPTLDPPITQMATPAPDQPTLLPTEPVSDNTAAIETADANESQPTQPSATPTEQIVSTASEPPPKSAESDLAGLIYRLEDQLFKIGPDGRPVELVSGIDPQLLPAQFTPRAAVSADGAQMLSWSDWSDLYLIDLVTGETSNITNTPDSEECCAQFWPGRPDTIIFSTRLKEADTFSFKIAAVNVDGSNYRLLNDVAPTLSEPALSPDGNTIAYDAEGKPWIYPWEAIPEIINLTEYNLEIPPEVGYGLTNPAWSPTGQYIAWMISGDPFQTGRPQGGALVFDLQGKGYRHLHPFEPAGGGGGFHPPAWSHDGNWIAVFDQSFETPGVWVMHLDGSGEVLAYAPSSMRSVLGLQAWWSPNSQHLLVTDPNAEKGIHLTLLNLLTGQIDTPPLPAGALPIAWVN
ncbi:MAG: Tol biopolymer transport system component [Arenicella sp.]|jgi:Tol biopolymer transport system component